MIIFTTVVIIWTTVFLLIFRHKQRSFTDSKFSKAATEYEKQHKVRIMTPVEILFVVMAMLLLLVLPAMLLYDAFDNWRYRWDETEDVGDYDEKTFKSILKK